MKVHEHEPDYQSDNDGDHDLPYDIAVLPTYGFLGRLIRSFDRLQNGLNPGCHTTGHVAGAKSRNDLVSDDLRRPGICQNPLESIPDFDTNFSLPYRHQQQDAVVGSLLAELPCRRHTMGKFLD